jgi:hypothetical protein
MPEIQEDIVAMGLRAEARWRIGRDLTNSVRRNAAAERQIARRPVDQRHDLADVVDLAVEAGWNEYPPMPPGI